jgi:DNA-binding XRE family transcriptional regulator
MRLIASSSPEVLLIKARQKLSMTQSEFSSAVGSSVRTVARWEGRRASPGPWHYHKLAALLYPLDPALAHDAALLGGKTLEELGLVPPPPAAPPPPPPPAPPPLPNRVLVDAVVLAAVEVLGPSTANVDSVRATLRAAFAHARDLRLSPAEVADALAPLPLVAASEPKVERVRARVSPAKSE